MDLRPEIEITVPDGLENEELVNWIHSKYHGLLANKEVCRSCGGGVGLGTEGIIDPIIQGLHKRCRIDEEVFKVKNL